MKKLSLTIATAVAVFATSSSMASVSPKLYSMKGESRIGSHIPDGIAKSNVSFSKSYDALSESERSIVRAKFNNLQAQDTPPFPAAGLKTIYRPLIKANAKIAARGRLEAIATVDASGKVTNVVINETPSAALARKAKRVLKNTDFDAASCDGVACTMNFPVQVVFN